MEITAATKANLHTFALVPSLSGEPTPLPDYLEAARWRGKLGVGFPELEDAKTPPNLAGKAGNLG